MNKETLQTLIEVHNILYGFPVQGEGVIPMAQVLATLQNTIQNIGAELADSADTEADVED